MHRKLTLAGLTLLLLSFVTVTQAYHITGSAGPIGTSHQWNMAWVMGMPPIPVLCEDDDFFGTPPFAVISTPGTGGLCYMSPGYTNVAGVCTATGGRSNGLGPDYRGTGTCPAANALPFSGGSGDWIDLQMLDSNNVPIPFIGQIDGHSCATATTTFRYDQYYAYTADDGHVAGFPPTFAGEFAPGVGNPLALGTYTTSAAPAAVASGCDAPRPFDQI